MTGPRAFVLVDGAMVQSSYTPYLFAFIPREVKAMHLAPGLNRILHTITRSQEHCINQISLNVLQYI